MNKQCEELIERFEISSDMEEFMDEIRSIGYAYRKNGEDHYLVRLNTLPGLRYYVRRDFHSKSRWIIFSGIIEAGKSKRFFNPVGIAERVNSNYLKLHFLDLNLIGYLRLSPRDYHLNTKVA